jgi:uncharacterized protein
MTTIAADAPLAVAVTEAIRAGDLAALRPLLRDHPDLAAARLGDEREARTLLHVATDWPGHFPNGPAVVAALVEAGADAEVSRGAALTPSGPAPTLSRSRPARGRPAGAAPRRGRGGRCGRRRRR